ncbi:MAG: hypothetical protein ACLS85_00650 [Coprobacillus cateniformis]
MDGKKIENGKLEINNLTTAQGLVMLHLIKWEQVQRIANMDRLRGKIYFDQ